MRLAMPAFRTPAGPDSAPCKGTSHATPALSDATLSLSSARPHPTASFSHHFVFLLVHSVQSVHSAHSPSAPAATAATWHGKGIALQVAAEPSLDDLAQVAGDERDHLDAM